MQKQRAELISSNIKLGLETQFSHAGFQWDFLAVWRHEESWRIMGHFVQEADLVAILKKMINTKYFDIISDMVFYCVIPLSKRLAMKHVFYV